MPRSALKGTGAQRERSTQTAGAGAPTRPPGPPHGRTSAWSHGFLPVLCALPDHLYPFWVREAGDGNYGSWFWVTNVGLRGASSCTRAGPLCTATRPPAPGSHVSERMSVAQAGARQCRWLCAEGVRLDGADLKRVLTAPRCLSAPGEPLVGKELVVWAASWRRQDLPGSQTWYLAGAQAGGGHRAGDASWGPLVQCALCAPVLRCPLQLWNCPRQPEAW